MTLEISGLQFDGCTYKPGGYNCTCGAHRAWMYRASQGRITLKACDIRRETGDRDGGTNLRQMQTIAVAHGITKGVLYQPADADDIFDLVETGRYGSHWNVLYEPFVGTPFDRFSGRFRGNHDLYLSRGGSTPGTIRTMDPGNGKYVDIPKTLLKRGAGLLDLGNNETLNSEFGSGKVYAYVTPADPPTPATLYHFRIKSLSPVYRAPETVPTSHLRSGSGPCRKSTVNGHLWFQIVKPGSPVNTRWLHAGPTIDVRPI